MKKKKEKIYTVIIADRLQKKLTKIKNDPEVVKVRDQLQTNPYVGKALGYKFLREKRIGDGKLRLYYLVYEDLVLVMIVATSDKKEQQAVIDKIKWDLSEFKKDAENYKKDSIPKS